MSKRGSILYVEDDASLAFITKYNLEAKGYEVVHCVDGKQALDIFPKQAFNICLLDVMLPEIDGFTLAAKIRGLNKDVPIIFLTVKSLLEDKIAGLQTGADDYLTKPFHLEELVLKIEVFLKRPSVKSFQINLQNIGSLAFDFNNLVLKNGNDEHRLTLKEAELLQFLFQHKNHVLKREEILKTLWGTDDYFIGRSLDVFISRLRKYLGREQSIKIENIHGVGFRMKVG
ncbi:MAG TPA: response regulator transcription factor [Cytophagaceae bacterium]|jgi:DNA-binding response OmpR family regulator